MTKPSIPSGTRDFLPLEMQKRNYIFDTIKKYFHLYGFVQIETPAIENLGTLTGKYGDEGDQLLFKILNSRIHESKDKEKLLEEFKLSLDKAKNSEKLTERALRYDLTVPFARYVVQHRNDITMPFKRYQIQPVWRADRPQKGRYREFFQCDADIIGSDSLLNEVQLIQLMDDVYVDLGIPTTIKLNNRKILSGIAEVINEKEKIVDITVAIDKLDKIGVEGVNKELAENGINAEAIKKLQPLIEFKGNTIEKINFLKTLLASSQIGLKGIEELEYIFNSGIDTKNLELDITLARGLNYYTGSIIEVKANAGSLSSSITGGGRYDDLTGIFGMPNVSGVGVSFGIDRVFDVMNDLNLFEGKLGTTAPVKVLFLNLGEAEANHSLQLITSLRKAGISADVYPDKAKENKQFDYAVKLNIPFICMVRDNNLATKVYELKNIQTKERWNASLEEMIKLLS